MAGEVRILTGPWSNSISERHYVQLQPTVFQSQDLPKQNRAFLLAA